MAEVNRSASRRSALVWVCIIILGGALPFRSAHAGPVTLGPITFTGSISNRSASVKFEQIGRQLKVTLINTSTADVLKAPDVLTAVFFSAGGDPKFKPASAVVPIGNFILFGKTGRRGTTVGGEWAYRNDLSGAPGDANEGISSAAFSLGPITSLFTAKNRFPGGNLQGPASPDGLQYGITSTNDNPFTGTWDVSSDNKLIKNTVVFLLNGVPSNWKLTEDIITDVSFQYGTALSDPVVPAQFENGKLIPEPSTFVLAGAGVLLAGLLVRKRR